TCASRTTSRTSTCRRCSACCAASACARSRRTAPPPQGRMNDMAFRPRNLIRIAHAKVTHDVPVYAHFGITDRCGLTCKMCGIWRYGNKKEELDLDQITMVAGRMARLGVAQVAIGGGEPFEREDLPEVCKAFIDAGINLRVLTNGVTTPWDQLDRCIDNGA